MELHSTETYSAGQINNYIYHIILRGNALNMHENVSLRSGLADVDDQ